MRAGIKIGKNFLLAKLFTYVVCVIHDFMFYRNSSRWMKGPSTIPLAMPMMTLSLLNRWRTVVSDVRGCQGSPCDYSAVIPSTASRVLLPWQCALSMGWVRSTRWIAFCGEGYRSWPCCVQMRAVRQSVPSTKWGIIWRRVKVKVVSCRFEWEREKERGESEREGDREREKYRERKGGERAWECLYMYVHVCYHRSQCSPQALSVEPPPHAFNSHISLMWSQTPHTPCPPTLP